MPSIRKSIYTIFRGKRNIDMNQPTIQFLDFSLAQLNKRPNITFEEGKKKKKRWGGHGSPSFSSAL